LEVRTVGLGVVGNLFNGISRRLDCTINKREVVVMMVEYFPDEPDEPIAYCKRCGFGVFKEDDMERVEGKIYCMDCYWGKLIEELQERED